MKKIISLFLLFSISTSAYARSMSIENKDIIDITINEINRGKALPDLNKIKMKALLTIATPGVWIWNSYLAGSKNFKLKMNESVSSPLSTTVEGSEILRVRSLGYQKNMNSTFLKNSTPDMLLDVYKDGLHHDNIMLGKVCFKVTSESCAGHSKVVDVLDMFYDSPTQFVFEYKDGLKIDMTVSLRKRTTD